MQDLSEIHGSIKGCPNHDLSTYELTEEQTELFRTNGFVSGIPVLGFADIEAIRNEIEELSDPSHAGREYWYEYNDRSEAGVFQGGFLHGSGAWRVRPGFHDLLWNPAITVPLRQLLGGPVRLLHDQVLAKPPQQGGSVSWHQDYSYWRYTQPMAHATCWIALDDATVANGCVHYVTGSHRWGVLLPQAHGPDQGIERLLARLDEEQRAAFIPVPAEVRAGEAIFHHPLMIHGSSTNTSDRPRRATTLHVMRDGTRAVVDLPEIDGLPAWLAGGAGKEYELTDTPAGRLLDGRFFPILD